MSRRYVLSFGLLFLTFARIGALGQTPNRPPKTGEQPSIGIVLTGGGSFGAFEAGAVSAFFKQWNADHGGPPPIQVVAGTSTGALIGPFVAMGQVGVDRIYNIYTHVERSDILSARVCDVLPFALFTASCSSAYGVGPLKRMIKKELPKEQLVPWDITRVAVVGADFGTGRPTVFTNSQADLDLGFDRFRDGVLASTISPLATPPIYIKPTAKDSAEPHLDGGVFAVAPIQVLFDTAERSPEINLTHIVIFSAYPIFPSDDLHPIQDKKYPKRPKFGDVGARMDALISEASITKDLNLARAAIELRRKGVTADHVKELTGLYIANENVELILYAPETRLGWDNLAFVTKEMRLMADRGLAAKPRSMLK